MWAHCMWALSLGFYWCVILHLISDSDFSSEICCKRRGGTLNFKRNRNQILMMFFLCKQVWAHRGLRFNATVAVTVDYWARPGPTYELSPRLYPVGTTHHRCTAWQEQKVLSNNQEIIFWTTSCFSRCGGLGSWFAAHAESIKVVQP